MKRICFLLLVVTLLLSLIAFSASADEQEPITITYWHHDASEGIVNAMMAITEMFEAENPGIKVDFLALPADSFYQKYVLAVATGTAPDAFGVRIQELASLINMGALEPLDDYMPAWDEYANLEAAALQPVRAAATDGKLYMLPGYTNVNVNWYNSKMFAENGITYPANITDFLSLCEQYADPDNGKYFYTFRGGRGAYSNLFPFAFSYSGITSFFDGDGQCTLNNPKFIEGLQAYIDIYKNGWTSRDGINNSYKEMVLEFGSETAMLMTHNSSSLPEHMKNLGEGNFMLGAASVPGEDGVACVAALDPIGASVSATSGQKEAALKLVEFYASAEAMSYYCEAVGKVPLNSGIYNDEWYASSPYMNEVKNILADPSIVWFQQPNYLPGWTDFCNTVDANVQALCLGEADAADIAAQWSDMLNESMAEYKAQ